MVTTVTFIKTGAGILVAIKIELADRAVRRVPLNDPLNLRPRRRLEALGFISSHRLRRPRRRHRHEYSRQVAVDHDLPCRRCRRIRIQRIRASLPSLSSLQSI